MSAILELSGVTKSYGSVAALQAVDLAIPDNCYVSLLGASGSGKTTLLRVIAGFEEPDRGRVLLSGKRLDGTPAHKRGIGFVFQNFALFPHLSVRKNVAYGLENADGRTLSPADVDRRVSDMIALVGLSGLEERGVGQISGGQRQRVALARTLVTEPRLVLLDEPLGALDANLRLRMRDELRSIRERLGVTFLHVTGSETEALAMGDVVIVLDSGRIGQVGDADTIYNRPATRAVARFLNCYNLFDGRTENGAFVSAAGQFPLAAAEQASAYGVRYDRIAVRDADQAAGADEVRLGATFLTSEYTGASVLSFFALPDGRVIEVEDHLSHRAPPAYQPQQTYGLVWKRDAALLFA